MWQIFGSVIMFQDLDEEREVTRDEIMEYCNSVLTPYIETSAKVGAVFFESV